MPVRIIVDSSEVKTGLLNFIKGRLFAPLIIDRAMEQLGRDIVPIMRAEIRPRRYTGALEDSVKSSYSKGARELSIGPTAKRGGRYDAGDILQLGTVPIPNVPWGPIKRWGTFRGFPVKKSYFVRRKIQETGVTPHPFVEQVVANPSFAAALERASGRLARNISVSIVTGQDTEVG